MSKKIKAVSATFGCGLFITALSFFASLYNKSNANSTTVEITVASCSYIFAIIAALLVISKTDVSLKKFGIRLPKGKNLYLYYLPCLLILIPMATYGFVEKIGIASVIAVSVFFLSAVLAEEFYFRGIATRLLRKHFNLWQIIFLSAGIYAICGITTVFNEADFGTAVLQVLTLFAFGILAEELLLLGKSIFGVALLHFAILITEQFSVVAQLAELKSAYVWMKITKIFIILVCAAHLAFLIYLKEKERLAHVEKNSASKGIENENMGEAVQPAEVKN